MQITNDMPLSSQFALWPSKSNRKNRLLVLHGVSKHSVQANPRTALMLENSMGIAQGVSDAGPGAAGTQEASEN